MFKKLIFSFFFLTQLHGTISLNQTETYSPIYPESGLPFRVQIEQASFSLPAGVHSYARGVYNGKWLILAGRTNGMHSFNDNNDNFPPSQQNTLVFVVDPINQTVVTKDLTDPTSGLTQTQIDSLSVTSPQAYYKKNTLYMTGGYGVDTATGQFSTKSFLTAINIPGLMHWVESPSEGETAAQHIRQISDPFLQVTGGQMFEIENGLTLLVFGQNFIGYYTETEDGNFTSGNYTNQVRRFQIVDNGTTLKIKLKGFYPEKNNPNFRRRDLNVVPMISMKWGKEVQYLCAYSGVFTIPGGIWTIPVTIASDGFTHMNSPSNSKAFMQSMNNYDSANAGLFSKKNDMMYTVLLGGLTYGYYLNGVFMVDEEIPFTNEVTTVNLDKHGNFKQYLMSGQYPVIPSTGSNPGNTLLFGAGAEFFLANNVSAYSNHVVKLDDLKSTTQIGYIVGGIMSTVPNTNFSTDSTASPYIFKVSIIPVTN